MIKQCKMFKRWATLGVFLMLQLICVNGFSVTPVHAQLSGRRISLSMRQATMVDIIKAIQKESSYHFLYQPNELRSYSRKDFMVNNASLDEALDELVSGTNLTYRIEKDMILIKISQQQKPKYKVVFGEVYDESGSPLPGVSVKLVGSHAGAQTNIKGHFALNVGSPTGKVILHFSYVGMASQNVEYKGKDLHITMHEDNKMMDEVVVTGYQTLSKRESASAISTIAAKDVMVAGAASIDQMLQGRIPGMAVMMTSGEPSATPKIRIRGNATINGNKSPVWVVDNVILEQDVPFSASAINSEDAQYLIGNAISGLNPQDIETITVLKDASATAIYGVKAANGVIVITTKKGRTGKPTITYNGDFTINTRPSYDNFNLMNSQQRVEFSKMLVDNGFAFGRDPLGETYEAKYEELLAKAITLDEFKASVNKLQTRNTNWFKYLFRNNITHTHTFDISGGSDNVRYYMSAGFSDVEGSAKKSDSRRFNSLARIDATINKHISFFAKMDFSTTSNGGYFSTNPFTYAYNTNRTIPAYNDDGSYYMAYNKSGYTGTSNIGYNILKELEETGQSSKIDSYNALFQLNVKFIEGLRYTGTFSWSNANTSSRNWATEQSYYIGNIRKFDYGKYTAYDAAYWNSELPYGGVLSQSNTRKTGYTLRNQLEYKKSFNDIHSFDIIGGIEARRNAYKGVSQTGYGWTPEFGEKFNPVLTSKYITYYLEGGVTNPKNTNSFTQVASYYGIFSYAFKSKYIFDFNIRSDGSNKFGSNPKYRWLPTYSFSGKWNINEESFLKSQKWIDYLALRGSYGIQGNISENDSPYLILSVGGRDNVLALPKSTINKLPNPDLRWEKTYSWNLAVDFSFLNNRIRGGIDFYGKHTKDLIISKMIAASNGTSSMDYNVGKMKNSGFEGFINTELIHKKDWTWNVGFNFSRNVNEVVYANKDDMTQGEIIDKMLSGNLPISGDPIGSMYAYHFAGINQDIGYPLFYTKSDKLSIQGSKADMDLVRVGSIFPKLTGGFDTELKYKDLSLSLNFAYSFGSKSRIPSYFTSGDYIDPLDNVSKEWLNCWKKTGDNTIYPTLYNYVYMDNYLSTQNGKQYNTYNSVLGSKTDPFTMYNLSDIRVAKADFLKLKLVSLTYMAPRKLINHFGIKNLLLRLQVTNIFTIADKKWHGLDPETGGSSIPNLSTYSLNVNVSF